MSHTAGRHDLPRQIVGAAVVPPLRADRNLVREELDAVRTEHRQAIKELRAEYAAAADDAGDLSADRVAAAEAT
jgi:hypothetical protein